MNSSGATGDLKLCADIASVLGLRYAVKFVSFRNLKGNLRTESLLINIVDGLLEHQTLEDLGERGKYRDRSILCVLFWIVDFRDG